MFIKKKRKRKIHCPFVYRLYILFYCIKQKNRENKHAQKLGQLKLMLLIIKRYWDLPSRLSIGPPPNSHKTRPWFYSHTVFELATLKTSVTVTLSSSYVNFFDRDTVVVVGNWLRVLSITLNYYSFQSPILKWQFRIYVNYAAPRFSGFSRTTIIVDNF